MRVLLVAGEASGDAHAAKVVRHLRAQGATITAVGGNAVQDAGATLVAHIEELAVLGFVEVVQRLPRLLALKRDLERRLQPQRWDLFLGVDFPGLNLRLAASAHRAGIPVLHYIGPQIWAWRAHRLQHMRQHVDHVALVLPFEKPLYDAAGVPATFVGHPLLDDLAEAVDGPQPGGDAASVDFDIGLFPGSRPQEVRRHLPLLLQAAALVSAQRPGLRLVVSAAPTAPVDWMHREIAAFGFGNVLSTDPSRILMRRARALLVASGTATLEAALAGTPFAVLYCTHRLNYELTRRLVRLHSIALANLVAQDAVVREYLQEQATPQALAAETARLLDDEAERERIAAGLARVRARLGQPGAAARVAALASRVVHGTAVER